MKFLSDVRKMKDVVPKEQSLERRLELIEQQLSRTIGQLNLRHADAERLKRDLRVKLQGITDLRDRTRIMAQTLSQAAQLYERTEAQIAGNVSALSPTLRKRLGELISELRDAVAILGMDLGSLFSLDPVNLSTGNYVYENTFLTIPSELPLSFRVFYNSASAADGPLTSGWVHNYGLCLQRHQDRLSIVLEDGARAVFLQTEDESLIAVPGAAGQLFRQGEGFVYLRDDKSSCFFTEEGRLSLVSDRLGNAITFTHDENDRLVEARGNQGNALRYDYDADGRMTAVQDDAGRLVKLASEDGRLCAITNPDGHTTRYRYDAAGRLCAVVNPRGIESLLNVYDERARVVEQTFPDGGVIRYDYHDAERQLALTEQNGNRVVYERDERYRNTRTIYTDGEEGFAYNDHNQRTAYTDKRGFTTSYAYDVQGSLTRMETPLGDVMEVRYTAQRLPEAVSVNGQILHSSIYDEAGRETAVSDALGRERRFAYDEIGNLIACVQEDGSEIRFAFNEQGDLATITDALGNASSYEYDNLHRVVATIDGNGNRTVFEYNARNDVVRVTNALGAQRLYEYDACGNVIRIEDFDGGVQTIAYNELNMPASITDPDGNMTAYRYDLMWNLSAVTDANGGVTRLGYDALHRRNELIGPDGARTQWKHDPNGNVIERIDPTGASYRIEYDALNRPIKVEEPNGMITRAAYNALSDVTEVRFANDTKRTFAYDAAGQLTAVTDPAGHTVYYRYNALGLVEEVYDDQDWMARYEYLPGGALLRESVADGTSAEYAYDGNGNVSSVTDQDGFVTRYAYDGLSRLVRVWDDTGAEERLDYDAAGRVIAATDACGARTTFTYSPAGDLLGARDALGHEALYAYDKLHRLTRVTRRSANAADTLARRGDERVTMYERDEAGRVRKITDALGHEILYGYDGRGDVLSVKDADGFLTQCAYNPDGTLRQLTYGDGRTALLSYNGIQQLVQVEDWIGLTRVEPDELGRAARVTLPDGAELSNRWNLRGELVGMTYPDGTEMTRVYDDAGRLTQTRTGAERTAYDYLSGGKRKSQTYANGWRTDYSYDAAGRLASVMHGDGAGATARLAYAYDPMGRKSRVERQGDLPDAGVFSYTYDAVGNLTSVARDGEQIEKYRYDDFGNRVWSETAQGASEYHYDAMDQLVRRVHGGETRDYRYDNRGNLLEETMDGQSRLSLFFDAQNRIARAQTPTAAVTYLHNALGQRVSRTAQGPDGSVNDQYVFDPTREFDNLLQWKRNNKSANLFWHEGAVDVSGEAMYLMDDLHSPLLAVGSARTEAFAFSAFGMPERATGMPTRFAFGGYLPDDVTGLSFAQRREYAPTLGRFVSMDPYEGDQTLPVSQNRYAYCRNDPINYIDPVGLIWAWVAGGIVGATANVVTKIAGDVVKSVVNGKPSFSSWESYVGTAAGGFAQGSVYVLSGGNSAAAGAAGAATETFVTGGLEMMTGKRDGTFAELLYDTGASAFSGMATGFVFGKINKSIKIPGINSGQGNMDATWRGLMTKAARGQIKNVSLKSLTKGLITQGGLNFVDHLWSGLKKEATNRLTDWGKQQLRGVLDRIFSRSPDLGHLLPFLMARNALCPLEGA